MTAEDDEGPAVVLVIELSLVLTVALALLLLAGADDTEDMIRKKKKRAYALPRQMWLSSLLRCWGRLALSARRR